MSGVIFDTVGNLYGITQNGGTYGLGTVFKLSPSGSGWVFSTIYSFQGGADGQVPLSAMIFDESGNLYGTTAGAGAGGGGTVFKLSRSGESWTFSVLYGLPGTPNLGPRGGLAIDTAGNFYGTTFDEGAHRFGSVFKLMPGNGIWTYADIYDFTFFNGGSASTGGEPTGGVTLDASGNLYGTTPFGGFWNANCPSGCGVVWEITP